MTLTADQLTQRRKGIGASDVPAILGLDTYRTPFDVWYAKTAVQPTGHLPESGPSRWGHLLEPVIAGEYARSLTDDVLLEESGTLEGPEPWILATPDRVVRRVGLDVRWLLEIKSRSTRTLRDWGESGTDHVPAAVLCQVQWQMFVTGDERADVALFVADARELRTYTVRRDQSTIDMLAEECRAFWEGHVLAQTPPEVRGQHVEDYVRSRFATAGEGMRVASADELAWITTLAKLKAEAKRIESQIEPLETAIKLAIGDDKGLEAPGARVTWTNVKGRATTDWKAIATALGATPDLIDTHTRVGAGYRALRLTTKETAE